MKTSFSTKSPVTADQIMAIQANRGRSPQAGNSTRSFSDSRLALCAAKACRLTRSATGFESILACVLLGLAGSVFATQVSVDEILFQDGDNPAVLSGTVDVSFLGGTTLQIILTNTSTADAGSGGAGNLLAGVGFNLPAGVTISSGTASMAGSSAINFTAPGDDDVSSEWGYNNGTPTMGHFDGTPNVLAVNAVVSTQANDAPNQFAPGSLGPPPGLDGPDFGIASPNSSIGGQEGIQDHVTFTLNLAGTIPPTIKSFIEDNPVVLAFGSPAHSTIPEPSTWLLLAFGGLGACCRRAKA